MCIRVQDRGNFVLSVEKQNGDCGADHALSTARCLTVSPHARGVITQQYCSSMGRRGWLDHSSYRVLAAHQIGTVAPGR